jgi:hypothetical protein
MTLRFHSVLSQGLSSRTQTTLNAGENVRKKEPLYSIGGNVN